MTPLTLTFGQLETWLAQAYFPFVRVGACLMVAPMFGARFVPTRIRIVLTLAITVLVVPLLPAPDVVPFSGAGIVALAQQLLIGSAMGFALQMVFDSLGLAGQLLANSMGLSFAFNVDPLRGSSTAALGQFYIIVATLTFLAMGGHLAIIQVLTNSFATIPVGTAGFTHDTLWTLVLWGGQLFAGAIAIALPGVTALLIVNLAFGVVSRAAPALNLFAVGFPISLVVGLAIVIAGIGPLQQGVVELLQQGLAFVRALVGG